MTILCIDGSESMRLLMRLILEDAGHEVMTAEDGRQGLQLAGDADLIITELFIEGLDGLALAAELEENRPGLPLLMLTSEPDAGWRGGLPENIRGWLPKPFEPQVLTERVEKLGIA